MFGPPPILPGEDALAYVRLLARVSEDVKPRDIVERIWIRDVVDLTWEILRWRRLKKGFVSAQAALVLSELLAPFATEVSNYAEAEQKSWSNRDIATQLADRWLCNDPEVVAFLRKLEREKRISIDSVMSSAIFSKLDTIEQFDRLLTVLETRRNAVLREIDRRRAIFAQSLRTEIQKVEDADISITDPKSNARVTRASKKAA